MKIEFDPAKDAINRAKHGISLSEAEKIDWDTVIAKADSRRNYGEPRQIGYGLLDRRLHCVVFVNHGPVFRVISLRKANRREVTRYEKIQTA